MPSVLIVEDNEMNRDILTRRLRRLGYEVLVARDGHEALDAAHASHPDLMLLDLSIPGIDGWHVARALKGDAHTSGIPIIALTAHAMVSDRETALAAGCDEYETKPVEFARLLDKMTALLTRHNRGANTVT